MKKVVLTLRGLSEEPKSNRDEDGLGAGSTGGQSLTWGIPRCIALPDPFESREGGKIADGDQERRGSLEREAGGDGVG